MKKDVPIEIEIEVVEAGQPRPQRPGPEPSNTKGLRPFPLPDRPGRMPPGPGADTPFPGNYASVIVIPGTGPRPYYSRKLIACRYPFVRRPFRNDRKLGRV